MEKILQKIRQKSGGIDLVELLSSKLSGAELQSLLLAVYREKARKITPGELLRAYRSNRFVGPGDCPPLSFLKFETALLEFVQKNDFKPIEFGPVAPLGTSSAVAPVHQNNVLSATRHTEVVSDVTNLLALEVACKKQDLRKQKQDASGELRYCAIHRHLRAQQFGFVKFTPHFKILSMVTSGKDQGTLIFETGATIRQLNIYQQLLEQKLDISPKQLKLQFTLFPSPKRNRETLLRAHQEIAAAVDIPVADPLEKNSSEYTYYKDFRFKIVLNWAGEEYEIGDGGMVDWTQKLLQDRKERLLISGIGTEYLFKIIGQ